MTLRYIRQYYDVPAKRGGRVSWNGETGTITRGTNYIYVRFDGKRFAVPLHPKEKGLIYIAATADGEVADGD